FRRLDMASLAKARSLFNQSELKSFEKVLDRKRIGELSEAQLKKKIQLARKAMVKYRDLARKQKHAIKKSQGKGTGSQKTEVKQQLFFEIQNRLKTQLEKLSMKNRGLKKATIKKKPPLNLERAEETVAAKLA